jgi:hypothetical protein
MDQDLPGREQSRGCGQNTQNCLFRFAEFPRRRGTGGYMRQVSVVRESLFDAARIFRDSPLHFPVAYPDSSPRRGKLDWLHGYAGSRQE